MDCGGSRSSLHEGRRPGTPALCGTPLGTGPAGSRALHPEPGESRRFIRAAVQREHAGRHRQGLLVICLLRGVPGHPRSQEVDVFTQVTGLTAGGPEYTVPP